MSHMLPDIQTLKPVIIIAFPLVYVAILLAIDKMLVTGISKETMENWQANPSYWKSDAIYQNPADPRLLPPKKVKAMGWTINIANPWSVASLLFLIVMILAVVLLL